MRNLLKALVTTGGGTIAGQILGLIVNKILAQTLGATGVGFYSLIRQVQDTGTAVGVVGTGGLVQGLAARQGAARRRLFRAAIALSAIGIVVTVGILVLFPVKVAGALFDRNDQATVQTVMLCALTVALAIGNALLGAAINAVRAIGALVLISVGAAAVIAVLAYPVAQAAIDDPRMLVVLIAAPLLLQILAAFFVLQRLGWWQSLRGEGDAAPRAAEFRYFAGFFGMNLVLTAANVATMLFVRATIVHAGGLATAGLFAAGWGIGMQTMALVLSSFGTYVLPTLAASSADERRKHLQDAATLVLCATIPMLTGLIVFKPLVMRALFSAQFLPAVSLLQWLLIGNYLKAISWVMAIPLLAAADLRRYFTLELGWFAVFAPLALLGIENGYGIDSVGFAFFIAYAVYLIAGAWFTRVRFGFVMHRRSTLLFLSGAALIGAAAAATWNDQAMNWPIAIAASVAGCVAALFGLTPRQRGMLFALVPIGRR